MTSSSPPLKWPAPSAAKLPARENTPEAFDPDMEKANDPWKEEVEYPEMVTVALAEASGKSRDSTVTITVEPIGGVFGAV